MSRSQRMDPIRRMRERAEREAARSLGQSRQKLDEAQRQLEELHDYQAQYMRQAAAPGGSGLRAADLWAHQTFISRLGTVIEQQKERITSIQEEHDLHLQQWETAYAELQSMERLIERFQAEERAEENRREQSDLDDRVTSLYSWGRQE